MRELGRLAGALAALGAGLVHLGAAARSAPLLLTVLVLTGLLEVAWCCAALLARRAVLPRAALVGSVGAAALAVLTVAVVRAAPDAPLLGGIALDLVVALLLAGRRRAPAARPLAALPWVAGVLVAALTVTAVIAVSLTAGQPAQSSMPGMGM